MYPRFEQVNVYEQQLVVQLFHLARERADDAQRLRIIPHRQMQRRQSQFNAMSQKRPSFRSRPLDVLSAQLHLHRVVSSNPSHDFNQSPHDFRRLRLWRLRQHRSQLAKQRLERVRVVSRRVRVSKSFDGEFFVFDRGRG